MKEVETDMREAAVRYFEGCLSAQDEERLYRFIQESGGNYSLFKEWERQWLETSVANERTEFEWEKLQARLHTRKAVTPMLLPGVGAFWRKIAAVVAIVILTAVKSNFLQRAITGVIFVAVLVGCILGGPISFTILFALISALTINEFGNIVNRMEHTHMNKPISILAGLFLFLCFGYIGVVPGANEIFIPYLFLILYLFISELYKKQPNPLNNWAYAMMSQIYIALSFALLNVLAYHSSATESVSQYNPILPLSIFIFNWVNDTGAYCTGMLFGKHRLFERISPKKSWEGSIGGAVFSIIAAIVLAHFFTFLSTGVWIGLGLTVVVFGTWGDLTESLMKRTLGIKDSSNILPGHGGMLDRFDSTLMAVPAAVVYLYLVGLILA